MSFNTSLHREDNLPDDFIFRDSDDMRIYLEYDFTLFLKHNIKVYEGLMYMLHEHNSWEISSSIIVLVHAISNKPLFMETDSYVSGALHNFLSSRIAKVPVGSHDDDSVWWYDGSKSWFKMMDCEDDHGNDASEMSEQPPTEVCMEHPSYESEEWQW